MASSLARILSSTRSTLFSTSGRAVTHSPFFNSKAFRFFTTSDICNIDINLDGKSILKPNLNVFHIRDMDALNRIYRNHLSKEIVDDNSGKSNLLKGRNRLSKEIVDDNSDKSNLLKGRFRKLKAWETAEGVHLLVVVPGLHRTDLNVFVEQNTRLLLGEEILIIECKSRDNPDDNHEFVLEKLSFIISRRLFQSDAINVKLANFGLEVFVPYIHVKAKRVDHCATKFLYLDVVQEKK